MILLTGVTGKTGGATAQALLGTGLPLRAIVRSEDKAAALKAAGVQLVIGDLGDQAVLDRALAGAGFDAARDIEGITANRWSHGYSYEYMRPWDGFWPRGPLPCETARRGWGRIAIAGSDSGAYAYAHSAIDQAARAVQELLPMARLPAASAFPGPDPKRLGLA